jgi:hypothetical protein
MNMIFPYIIESVNGERITFLTIYSKNGIEYIELINELIPNAGPPMHVHYKQDEYAEVIEGKMT